MIRQTINTAVTYQSHLLRSKIQFSDRFGVFAKSQLLFARLLNLNPSHFPSQTLLQPLLPPISNYQTNPHLNPLPQKYQMQKHQSFIQQLRNKLPTETTQQKTSSRNKLWKMWDTNGNGFVSLAQATKQLSKIIEGPEQPDQPTLKLIIQKAACEAKKTAKSNSPRGIQQIEKAEFRLFLLYFLQGVEYAVAFRRLDVNCDGRIDREELGKGKQVLLRWKIDPEKYESLLEEARKEAPIGFARFAQWLEEMENFDMEAEEVGAAE